MLRMFLVALFAVGCSTIVLGQTTDAGRVPKFEVFVGYSGNGYNHDKSLTGIDSFPISPYFSNEAGGTGFQTSTTRSISKYFGMKADFSMYFNKEGGPGTFKICQQDDCTTSTQPFTVNSRTVYFMAGPEIRVRNRTRLTPFAHALFGVAHSHSEFKTASPTFNHFDQHTRIGFSTALGGGLDIRVTRRISLRTTMDYMLPFLGESDLGAIHNRVRIGIGIVFH